MAQFQSALRNYDLVVDRRNAHLFAPAGDVVVGGILCGRGWRPRDWKAHPYGKLPYAKPFPRELYVPRDEWRDRAEHIERSGSRLSDLCIAKGLTVLNQARTNYCWGNGVIRNMEILQVKENRKIVRLSPASVCAPIKRYRNVGGWGQEALDYILKNGVAPVDLWPANAIDERYDNAESRAARAAFTVFEWIDLPPGDFDALYSLLLRGIPVPIGLDWWRHLVCAVDPLWVDGRPAVGVDNSHGEQSGNKGRLILSQEKATPSDASCASALNFTAA